MTKQEVVDKCNAIYQKIDDLKSGLEDALYEVRQLERKAEELPDDPNQIEDNEVGDTRD